MDNEIKRIMQKLENLEGEINKNDFSYKEFTLWVIMIFGFFSVALFAILWWL